MLVLYFGICQLVVPEKYKILSKNIVLFAGSIIFYAYGEPVFVLLLIFSIFINWLMGFLIGKAQKKDRNGKTYAGKTFSLNDFMEGKVE